MAALAIFEVALGQPKMDASAALTIIDRILAERPRTAEHVERLIGAKLTALPPPATIAEGTDLEAGGVRLRRVTIQRNGPGDGARTALAMEFTPESAPSRQTVLDRYGPLAVTGAPRGRSLADETQYGREEAWGWVTFGFAERDRERLSTLTVITKPAP